MVPKEINALITIPAETSYVSIKEEEAEFLYEFIRKNGLKRSVETGLGYGRSACHIMAAHGGRHIAMDPFQKDYGYLAISNIEAAGMKEMFDFREDYSHHVLPELLREGFRFDLAFIDGDHKFDGILLDFHYAALMLEAGGYIIFHDTWMRSTQLVSAYIRKNRADFEQVACPLRNFHIFRKTGTDQRDGMYFREFYTNSSRLKYRIITWLLEPGDSFLKRLVRKIKDWVK